ncbi:lysine-specific demethylase 5C-like, partial [Columba livia]
MGTPQERGDHRLSPMGTPQERGDPKLSPMGTPQERGDHRLSPMGTPQERGDPKLSPMGTPQERGDPKLSPRVPPGVRGQRVEPERDAGAAAVGAVPHQRRHLGDEGALALRGDGVLRLLLAHRGPLELLHQLPPLGGAQNLVRGPLVRGRALGRGDEEADAGAFREPTRPVAPTRHPHEPQHPHGPRGPRRPHQPVRRRVRHHLPPRLPQRLQPGLQLRRGRQLLHRRLGEHPENTGGPQNTAGNPQNHRGTPRIQRHHGGGAGGVRAAPRRRAAVRQVQDDVLPVGAGLLRLPPVPRVPLPHGRPLQVPPQQAVPQSRFLGCL